MSRVTRRVRQTFFACPGGISRTTIFKPPSLSSFSCPPSDELRDTLGSVSEVKELRSFSRNSGQGREATGVIRRRQEKLRQNLHSLKQLSLPTHLTSLLRPLLEIAGRRRYGSVRNNITDKRPIFFVFARPRINTNHTFLCALLPTATYHQRMGHFSLNRTNCTGHHFQAPLLDHWST